MFDNFWVQLVLAFLIGGLAVSIAALLVDRFGSKKGGFIGGFPSTSFIALIFIGIDQGVMAATQASVTALLSLVATGVFLVFFAYYIDHGYIRSLVLAFVIWFGLAAVIFFAPMAPAWLAILVFLGSLPVFYWITERKLHCPEAHPIQSNNKASTIFKRASISGSIIALALVLAHFGGPTLGGVFSIFPASFLATLTQVYQSRGVHVMRSVVKPLLLSAMINIGILSMLICWLYPIFGIGWGSVLAYAATIILGTVSYWFIRHKTK